MEIPLPNETGTIGAILMQGNIYKEKLDIASVLVEILSYSGQERSTATECGLIDFSNSVYYYHIESIKCSTSIQGGSIVRLTFALDGGVSEDSELICKIGVFEPDPCDSATVTIDSSETSQEKGGSVAITLK